VTTAELRRAVKAVDARARVSKVDDGHWTIRAWDSAAVEKLLPSLGLEADPRRTDIEGSRWHWMTLLHVFEAAGHATKKKDAKLPTVKIGDRDWQWVRSAGEGDAYAQERVADLLGWSGDDGHRALVREWGKDYAIVEVEIDGSIYGRYKLR
jgi:hypothetical protein